MAPHLKKKNRGIVFPSIEIVSILGDGDDRLPEPRVSLGHILYHLTGLANDKPENIRAARKALLEQHPELQPARNEFLKASKNDAPAIKSWCEHWVSFLNGGTGLIRLHPSLTAHAENIFRHPLKTPRLVRHLMRPSPLKKKPLFRIQNLP
jgi:hypothetical protein